MPRFLMVELWDYKELIEEVGRQISIEVKSFPKASGREEM